MKNSLCSLHKIADHQPNCLQWQQKKATSRAIEAKLTGSGAEALHQDATEGSNKRKRVEAKDEAIA